MQYRRCDAVIIMKKIYKTPKISKSHSAAKISTRIEFSPHLDVYAYHCLTFTMTPVSGFTDKMEILVKYAPISDRPGHIMADVWAGLSDGNLLTYLFTDEFLSDEREPNNYAKIASQVHNNAVFQKEFAKLFGHTCLNAPERPDE